MKSKRIVLILTLGVAYLLVASFLLVSEMSRPIGGVPFTTLAEGYWGGFRYGDSSYTGEYMVIRNQSDWASFWYNHTSNIEPPSPAPTNISWDGQMVLVAYQGYVTDCCESYVEFIHAEVKEDVLYAYVENVHRSSMSPAITNPFHIIVTESIPNVVFVEISERPSLLELILWVTLLVMVVAVVLTALRWRPRTESLR